MKFYSGVLLALSAIGGAHGLVQPSGVVPGVVGPPPSGTALNGFRQNYMEQNASVNRVSNFVEQPRNRFNQGRGGGMYDQYRYEGGGNERFRGGGGDPRNQQQWFNDEMYYNDHRGGGGGGGRGGGDSKYERYNPRRHTKQGETHNFVEYGRQPPMNEQQQRHNDYRFDVAPPRSGDGGFGGDRGFYNDRRGGGGGRREEPFVDRGNGNNQNLQRYDRNAHRPNGENRGGGFYGGGGQQQNMPPPPPPPHHQDQRMRDGWGAGDPGRRARGGPYRGEDSAGRGGLMSDNEMRERNMRPADSEGGFGWQNADTGPRSKRGSGYDLYADNWWEGTQSKGDRRAHNNDSYDRHLQAGRRTTLERYDGRMHGRQNGQMGGAAGGREARRFEEPYRPGDRNLMGEDYHYGPRYLSGGKLERFSFDPSVSSVLVELWSEGLPIQATVEVLQESGKRRQSFPIYVEDGYNQPYSTVLDLPGYGGGTILIRNDGPVEYPITAHVQPQGGRKDMRAGGGGGNSRAWSAENSGGW